MKKGHNMWSLFITSLYNTCFNTSFITRRHVFFFKKIETLVYDMWSMSITHMFQYSQYSVDNVDQYFIVQKQIITSYINSVSCSFHLWCSRLINDGSHVVALSRQVACTSLPYLTPTTKYSDSCRWVNPPPRINGIDELIDVHETLAQHRISSPRVARETSTRARWTASIDGASDEHE